MVIFRGKYNNNRLTIAKKNNYFQKKILMNLIINLKLYMLSLQNSILNIRIKT